MLRFVVILRGMSVNVGHSFSVCALILHLDDVDGRSVSEQVPYERNCSIAEDDPKVFRFDPGAFDWIFFSGSGIVRERGWLRGRGLEGVVRRLQFGIHFFRGSTGCGVVCRSMASIIVWNSPISGVFTGIGRWLAFPQQRS